MVRLILTLTPVVCVLGAIAFSSLFEIYLKDEENPQDEQSGKNDNMYDEVIKTWCSFTVNIKYKVSIKYNS